MCVHGSRDVDAPFVIGGTFLRAGAVERQTNAAAVEPTAARRTDGVTTVAFAAHRVAFARGFAAVFQSASVAVFAPLEVAVGLPALGRSAVVCARERHALMWGEPAVANSHGVLCSDACTCRRALIVDRASVVVVAGLE